MPPEADPPPFKFDVGQIIHHKRYDYRGVIFDRDPSCQSDDAWYYGNQTQPPRDEPWYQVLVHGANHTTYVAEQNLEPDPTGRPVVHPWIERFFQTFAKGQYWRESPN